MKKVYHLYSLEQFSFTVSMRLSQCVLCALEQLEVKS